ncbi:Anti-anti-sigma regulatory factor (antagonist of anti-sigma factor) [Caenispirillum salinarum AK4]|uniref:Anti-sigma factor antagonist n=1 Tax=Caenispirillum salinarum AK4 TaxID=1238182 RepID=K9GVA1_9PROT|nr:STAS domain-containing protein [Caenispirillum salinarum]EKV28624.1 Anti-anti-sigma regulatory factor (antagonist of anti-sigma factor) [Caenispirillum salinarum AK4]
MTVDIAARGPATVAALSGEVDLECSPAVRRALLDALRDGRPVIVDLSLVSYIDSSGIASLVEAYQAARKQGTALMLAAVSPAALRVMQLARLDRVFNIRPTVDDALAVLAQ